MEKLFQRLTEGFSAVDLRLASKTARDISTRKGRQSRQTALMWQQQPDYARYKEKSNGEGWLVNRQDMLAIDGEEELVSHIL